MVKICEECGEAIEGKYLKAMDNFYHPEHFLCASCGRIIKGDFIESNGHPYHRSCYLQEVAPKCEYCGEPVDGGVKLDGEVYHRDCYRNNIASKCDICGEIIEGAYIRDFWRNEFCEKHLDDYPQCPYCNTLIAPNLKNRRVEYRDGRVVCGECDNKAVRNPRQVRREVRKVVSRLNKHGIDVSPEGLEVRLVPKHEFEGKDQKRGVTKFEERRRPGYDGFDSVEIEEINILIMTHLPDFAFRKVFAHELMHVWIIRNSSLRSDDHKRFLEGSCEYASYLVLSGEESEYGDLQIESLLENSDDVYGEGFRRVKDYVEENGIKPWLKSIKSGNPDIL